MGSATREEGGERTWFLVALQKGSEIWRQNAPGVLGTPTARDGVVFMPFMTQWLTMLDAATGDKLARIRQQDEAINFVRANSDGVFYGS